MSELLFCLGREPLLSLAELSSYANAEGQSARWVRFGDHLALADFDSPPEPSATLRRLGGTVRIGEVLKSFDGSPSEDEIVDILAPRLLGTVTGERRKAVFGLSMYVEPKVPGMDLKRLAGRAKERLLELGISARYVLPLRGQILSSAQVIENQLDSKGAEFVIGRTRGRSLLARTLAVQSPSDEAERDMEKPIRRLREGLLPPKIARIMVNLARQRGTRTLLDPFCGSGVVLMESFLLGLEPVGSDESKEAVEATQANLEWIRSREKRSGADSFRLIRTKAEELSLRLPPLSVDAVATEPYLGPPLAGPLSPHRAASLARELRLLYTRALAEIRILLRPGARCVFILPVFRTREGSHAVDLGTDLPLIGFREYNPFAAFPGIHPGQALKHSRPGQRVLRRILVLENRPQGQCEP